MSLSLLLLSIKDFEIMGNVESQNGDYALYGTERGPLSRKHMSRSLRVSNKQSRRSRHALSGKIEHRNSETSTRSSSTPSIPQSLADNGLEPFNETDVLPHFGSPIWVDRVAMNLRPVSFHNDLVNPSARLVGRRSPSPQGLAARGSPARRGGREGTYLQKTSDGSSSGAAAAAAAGDTLGRREKKRSKSADMWREDSLELSLSDISQDHLTSTEEIIDAANQREDYTDCDDQSQSSPLGDDGGGGERANSLDQLYSPKNTGAGGRRRASRGRYTARDGGGGGGGGGEDKMVSTPEEEGGSGYGAYTLPCRRSHCLSEGLRSHQTTRNDSMHGRRAQTIQVRGTPETHGEGESRGMLGLQQEREGPDCGQLML